MAKPPYSLYHLRPQRLLLLALLSLLGPWCTPHALVWAAVPSPAYQQALQAYRQGQYAQATVQFKTLALQYPEDTRLPYYLALLAVRQNQLQQAEAYYQQVLLLEPQGPVAPFAQKGLALLAMAKQQQEASQKTAEKAAKAAASNTPNGAPSLRELTGLQPTFGASAHPPTPKPPVFGHAVDGTPNITEPLETPRDKPPMAVTAEPSAKTTPMATEAPPPTETAVGRTPSTFKEGSPTTAVASTPPPATTPTPSVPSAEAAALAQQQQQQLMQQMMMMQMMSSMGGGGGSNSNSMNPMAMMAPMLMMQQQQQATSGGAAAGVGALPNSPFGGIDPKMLGDMMSQSMLNNMDLLGGGKNGDNDR